jgi:hypothetical protein
MTNGLSGWWMVGGAGERGLDDFRFSILDFGFAGTAAERAAGGGERGQQFRPKGPGWRSLGWSAAQPLVWCPSMQRKLQRGALSA